MGQKRPRGGLSAWAGACSETKGRNDGYGELEKLNGIPAPYRGMMVGSVRKLRDEAPNG